MKDYQFRKSDELNEPPEIIRSAFILGWCLLLALLLMIATCHPAQAYTIDQWATAIRHAEGVWNYGIKTVKCTTTASCREICKNTVRNNYARYRRYGFKHYSRYIDFLQSRYCPNTQCYPHQGEVWIKNVEWYLRHPIIPGIGLYPGSVEDLINRRKYENYF